MSSKKKGRRSTPPKMGPPVSSSSSPSKVAGMVPAQGLMTEQELSYTAKLYHYWPDEASIPGNPMVLIAQKATLDGTSVYIRGRALAAYANADWPIGDPYEQGETIPAALLGATPAPGGCTAVG